MSETRLIAGCVTNENENVPLRQNNYANQYCIIHCPGYCVDRKIVVTDAEAYEKILEHLPFPMNPDVVEAVLKVEKNLLAFRLPFEKCCGCDYLKPASIAKCMLGDNYCDKNK